jgi:UDP-N-acetylglucosamine/UDP-N-acetylgalactosamine diphosphorylase
METLRAGEAALAGGKVAAIMVAGGMSTRMGSHHLRGDLPVGPVTNRSIFSLQAERVLAVGKRYSAAPVFIVITSRSSHQATVESFERNRYFGLAISDVHFCIQPSLPVVDGQGKAVRGADGFFMYAPAGHGSTVAALLQGNWFSRLRAQGVEYLFYFQYPNVLERVCDPVLLGAHIRGSFEITTKAFHPSRRDEKVGRLLAVGSSETGEILRVIEYHAIEADAELDWMTRLPANSGSHVFSLSFFERFLEAGLELPYHWVRHSPTGESRVLFKAEQFIFDLLEHTVRAGYCAVPRDEEYAVVKNPSGPDSVDGARLALARCWRRWLDSVGAVSAAKEPMVEIAPTFALDANELKARLPVGFQYDDGLLLNMDGKREV